jgi:hypothetical protein
MAGRMTGDRPVSPRQAEQFIADLVFVRGRDDDLFDALWPPMPRVDVVFVGRVLPVAQTDSPRPFRFHYDLGAVWPLEASRN